MIFPRARISSARDRGDPRSSDKAISPPVLPASPFLFPCPRPPSPRFSLLSCSSSTYSDATCRTGWKDPDSTARIGTRGIPRSASSYITTPLTGIEERERERGALSRFGVCPESVSPFLDGRDQWALFPSLPFPTDSSFLLRSALTLSDGTCCILTAVLSPNYVSHSPVAPGGVQSP